jgi:hypothetical protein
MLAPSTVIRVVLFSFCGPALLLHHQILERRHSGFDEILRLVGAILGCRINVISTDHSLM